MGLSDYRIEIRDREREREVENQFEEMFSERDLPGEKGRELAKLLIEISVEREKK